MAFSKASHTKSMRKVKKMTDDEADEEAIYYLEHILFFLALSSSCIMFFLEDETGIVFTLTFAAIVWVFLMKNGCKYACRRLIKRDE